MRLGGSISHLYLIVTGFSYLHTCTCAFSWQCKANCIPPEMQNWDTGSNLNSEGSTYPSMLDLMNINPFFRVCFEVSNLESYVFHAYLMVVIVLITQRKTCYILFVGRIINKWSTSKFGQCWLIIQLGPYPNLKFEGYRFGPNQNSPHHKLS